MKKSGYFLIAAALAGIDLGIKEYVERHQDKFHVHHNKGFAANRLDDKQSVVAAVSAASTTAIAMGMAFTDEDKSFNPESLGWAIILGGAISNTFDRLRRRYVVDYIPLGRRIYNIGDFFIYTGAFITVIVNLCKS